MHACYLNVNYFDKHCFMIKFTVIIAIASKFAITIIIARLTIAITVIVIITM